MKRLRSAFVTGCLILLPVLATVDLVRWLLELIDSTARKYVPNGLLPFDFAGLGLAIAILLIVATGFLAQNYVGGWLLRALDHGLRRISLLGGVYSAIKKFLETVLQPEGTHQFHSTVLVPFPREGMYSIGFRTGKLDPKLKISDERHLVSVFIPCAPNPTSGFYLIVPEKDLIPLDLTAQEAFRIVLSMGIVTSEEHEA